jgi:hypothetical protein
MVSDLKGALAHGVAERLVSAEALGDRLQQVCHRQRHELVARGLSKPGDKITQPDGGRSELARVVLSRLVLGHGHSSPPRRAAKRRQRYAGSLILGSRR